MSLPESIFHHWIYQACNKARFDHFDWMNFDLSNKTVLELAAGIGDHTEYLLNKNAIVTAVEGRQCNFDILKSKYEDRVTVALLDIETDIYYLNSQFDYIYAYGILYHLSEPFRVLEHLSKLAPTIFIDTCIAKTHLEDEIGEIWNEDRSQPHYSIGDKSLFPGIKQLRSNLESIFKHIYYPIKVPNHSAFVSDWNKLKEMPAEARIIIVASNVEISNSRLTQEFQLQSECI